MLVTRFAVCAVLFAGLSGAALAAPGSGTGPVAGAKSLDAVTPIACVCQKRQGGKCVKQKCDKPAGKPTTVAPAPGRGDGGASGY